MTNEQIEQKKQQLKQLAEEVKALTKELAEAGAIELSEEELNDVAGGMVLTEDLRHADAAVEKPSTSGPTTAPVLPKKTPPGVLDK